MTLAELGALLNFLIVLVFVLLIVSLVASTIVEAIAGYLGTRGKLLRRRLTEMLDDPRETGFAALLLDSRLLRSLGSELRMPSYIPPETFAQSVIAVIREHRLLDPRDLPPVLRELALAEGFGTSIKRGQFRDSLVQWYDRAMARLSGNYKRMASRNLFIAGLVLAIGFDVDMIRLTGHLWSSRFALEDTVAQVAALHEQLAAAAAGEGTTVGELLEARPELREQVFALVERDQVLESLALPVGWTLREPGCPPSGDTQAEEGDDDEGLVCGLGDLLQSAWATLASPSDWSAIRIVGWLLTAVAVIPGAQFWFDALGRLLSLRAAGAKPPSPPAGSTGRAGDGGTATNP